MDRLIIPGEVSGEVDPPSSKSYAQRAIAAALLAEGTSVLSGIEMCDDTAAALRVVQTLGARVENPSPGTYAITGGGNGRGGFTGASSGKERDEAARLDIGESGLSTRLFTPIAALSHTPITITGHGSILTRPMDMMLGPLRTLGVEVTDKKGHLPITVRGPMRGGEVEIDGSVSSQFLTGLLVALPLAVSDTTVRVRNLRSIPYIDMTIDLMDRFGVDVDHRDYEEFYIPGSQTYTPATLTIEGDWSAASCLLVAGATASRAGGGNAHGGLSCAGVTVKNLNPVSLQADVMIVEALSRAGAHIEQTGNTITVSRRELRAFSFDATDCPDLFRAGRLVRGDVRHHRDRPPGPQGVRPRRGHPHRVRQARHHRRPLRTRHHAHHGPRAGNDPPFKSRFAAHGRRDGDGRQPRRPPHGNVARRGRPERPAPRHHPRHRVRLKILLRLLDRLRQIKELNNALKGHNISAQGNAQ